MLQQINPKHLRRSGRLVHFYVRRVLVSLWDNVEARKLLLLIFGRDGSVYAQFPYFKASSGVLKELTFRTQPIFPTNIDTTREAWVTGHLVKYSHHTDGEAHFSQDGNVKTVVRRKSFRLDGPTGHLFQLTAFNLDGFEHFEAKDVKPHRPSIEFRVPRMPQGVNVVAEWYRKSMFDGLIARSGEARVGPVLPLVNGATGDRVDHVLLSPPLEGKVSQHVLGLTCSEAEVPVGTTSPTAIFIGGWDHHEVIDRTVAPVHTGALFCTYPADAAALLNRDLESIDLRPSARAID